MDLSVEVYRLTRSFPSEERFGLTSLIRRAAVSVASNIAEGAGRGTRRDFIRFLNIARSSLAELETQIEVARRCELPASYQAVDHLCLVVGQMLSGLIRSLSRRASRP